MKYICFGYLDAGNWMKKSEAERNALIDACFVYDETLKENGHWAGGEGLQGPDATRTLRLQNGQISVTSGSYAQTQELLGGLLILEAKDLDQAVQLIANHPGMNMGTWEIRPVEDMTGMVRASEKRRAT